MNTYDIAGIEILLNPIHKDYLYETLPPYKSKGSFKYQITSHLVDFIKPFESKPIMEEKYRLFYEESECTILQVKHQSGKIKYQLITSNDYKTQRLEFVSDLVKDMASTEYILYSMSFLEVAMREGFLPLHASSLVLNGEAILFSAPSKTGKSTHVNYYLDTFKHAFNLNDDKPLIKDGYVYGTPFSGKSKYNKNAKYPLKAICFIKQGTVTTIEPLSKDESVIYLLKNILRPSKEDVWDKMIPIINDLLNIPIYIASLTNEQKSIYITYHGLYKEAKMRIKEGFKLREIGSTIMILPTDNEALNFNGIMTLNKTGKFLFEALKEEQTIDSLVSLLLSKYDCEKEEALKDVVEFIETLKTQNILL